jgi:hypothetical protein
MISNDPKSRLSASQALNHIFFKADKARASQHSTSPSLVLQADEKPPLWMAKEDGSPRSTKASPQDQKSFEFDEFYDCVSQFSPQKSITDDENLDESPDLEAKILYFNTRFTTKPAKLP